MPYNKPAVKMLMQALMSIIKVNPQPHHVLLDFIAPLEQLLR
jgi:hypothetical protein